MYLSKTWDNNLLGFGKCEQHALLFAGFRYNLSSISVRMYHSLDTDASASQSEDVIRDLGLVSAVIKPVFKVSVSN
jgi:hypothetical protein